MPIRQYFLWVGSALLLALFAADWWLPGSVAHTHSAVPPHERVNLRIRSDQKWPERVVFDTANSGMQLAAQSGSKLSVVPNQGLAAQSGSKLSVVPNQGLAAQTEQRSPLDAFAAVEAAQVALTATNDKASAIRAKPRSPGVRMSSAAKAD